MIGVAVMRVYSTLLSTSILHIKCAQNYFAAKQKCRLVITYAWPIQLPVTVSSLHHV